jgi:hypothetical protein
MAVVAGMLIVLLSFMALRLSGRPAASGAAPSQATAAQTAALPAPSATPAEAPSRIEPAQVTVPTLPSPTSGASIQAPELAHGDSRPAVPGRSNGAPASRRPHAAADSPATDGDLGEFKAKF